MPRARSVYACCECGAQQPRWLGRCPECGAWNTLVEEAAGGDGGTARTSLLGAEAAGERRRPVPLESVELEGVPRIATGSHEFDRVLGGGLVPGSVVLLGGEPGVGKSTLALQLAARAAADAGPVLYVTGEESPAQVRMRAERLRELPGELLIHAETRVEALAEPWRAVRPSLVLVDSIQTLHTDRVQSAPGSVAQVRESAALLAAAAKAQGTALVLIGHVTKDGSLAGPRVLEHLVDAVLLFEGDRSHSFRLLRGVKNRFGATPEVGVFTMTGSGLEEVKNPSELFLAERRCEAPGSCIVPVLEGSRPLLLEIQALLAPAGYGTARRTAIGIDDGRVALLLAVLDRRTDAELLSCDVYVNVTGGVRVSEPAADLGVALALVSSRLDLPVPADAVACGEVGLGGEVRRVPRLDLRVQEAARLGFRRVLVPEGSRDQVAAPPGVSLVPLRDAASALRWLRASSPGNAGVNGR